VTAELTRVRFSVDDYHRMGEVGILDEDDRVELIDGEIVAMSPVGSLHAGTVNRLNRLLTRALGDTAVVALQNPVQLSDDTESEPDLAVLLPRDDFYTTAHPLPADVLLLIEVADRSLPADRRVKLPRYAQAAIRESWLVNLDAGEIERHTNPDSTGYRDVVTLLRGQRLASTVVAGLTLAGDQILGPA
jgi:Uma2 family endonuclease